MAGVHAFDSDEKLSVLLEFVLVSETDLGQGSASTGVVHNVFHYSLDVSAEKGGNAKVSLTHQSTKVMIARLKRLIDLPSALRKVQGSESGGGDSLGGVGLKDRAATTSLH